MQACCSGGRAARAEERVFRLRRCSPSSALNEAIYVFQSPHSLLFRPEYIFDTKFSAWNTAKEKFGAH